MISLIFNTTMMALVNDYLLPTESAMKKSVIASSLLSMVPVITFFFGGKMIVSGFGHYKTFYQSVVEFRPYYNATVTKFIECFRSIICTFWLMVAILVVSPFYPLYLLGCYIVASVWQYGVWLYYWKWPKKPVYSLEGSQTDVPKAVSSNKSRSSRVEYELPRTGPMIPTQHME